MPQDSDQSMPHIKNILFIMADQLRWDYLSCYGHPHLQTPNIDGLAAKGVRFDLAYVQSPVCGPSRASIYTGRTVFSHGSTWNSTSLPIGEMAIRDYLEPHGVRTAVVGKSHMVPDKEGIERLGVDTSSETGQRVAQPGFEPFDYDTGIHTPQFINRRGSEPKYNAWLRSLGYESENPWHDFANSAEGPDGEILSGWHLRNSDKPARVAEEHSETAYMTMRAREFIEETGDQPWLCHLSFIKPHWPYMAPVPYYNMYGPETFLPVNRNEEERDDPNPVFEAFMQWAPGVSFSRDAVRETVLPAYMGLIKQIDDHLGQLFKWLEKTGRDEDTLIVFTSDHGDYLGDHWMGEKDLFHDCSVRVPLIIFDPRPEADATRGSVCTELVEAIDLLPTFLDAVGTPPADHILEGRSLTPLLHGQRPQNWRDAVFSEIDYAYYEARTILGEEIADSRGYMLRTERWKYVYFRKHPPQLFDLKTDPNEIKDLGRDPSFENVRNELKNRLLDRVLSRKNRVSESDARVEKRTNNEAAMGVHIGLW